MNQFEMKKMAYQSRLRNRALQVLLYLIDRANREQTCFPAVPTISRELHISISTVKRAMRELVEAGYVKKESRFRVGNGGQTSNLYTLHFSEKEKMPEETGETGESEQLVQVKQSELTGVEHVCAMEGNMESQYKERDSNKGKSTNGTHVYLKVGRNCGIIKIFSPKGGNAFACVLQWPGVGVNLIPP